MTTPGGIANLPAAAMTGATIGQTLQNLTPEKLRQRAGSRAPAMFANSPGGDALDVSSPLGLMTQIFGQFMSSVANADPADIQGPEDLPDLLVEFLENLPVVGPFVEVVEAMLGVYTGDDPQLLQIQEIFELLRKVLELIGGVATGNLPTIGQLVDGFEGLAAAVGGLIEGLFKIPLWQLDSGGVEVIDRFDGLSTVDAIEGWSWDDADGHDADGCALFTASGTPGVLLSPTPVEVREGEQYTVSAWAKATGVSGGGITLGVQWYDADHVALSTSTAESVASPATAWAQLSGSVTVPAGAKFSRRMLRCENTAGEVRWDDVRFKGEATSIAQDWVTGLPGALADLGDWIESLVDQLLGALGVPSLGTLFDKISDLSDEVESWLGDTQDRAADLLNLIDDLWSSPSSVIGSIPQALVSGLDTTLNQIRDVFDGLVVTPVNSVVGAIKDWFDQWFGGGSGNAIPLSQKGAASGVAPLNSSSKLATSYLETNVNNGVAGLNSSGKIATSLLVTDSANNVPTLDGSGKIQSGHLPSMNYIPTGDKGAVNGVAPLNSNAVVPLANLPEEVGGLGGTGGGLPYVMLYRDDAFSVPNNTRTPISGWIQTGTTSVTFADGTNTKWRFGLSGVWQISVNIVWQAGSTTGYRTACLNTDYTVALGGGSPSTFHDYLTQHSQLANAWTDIAGTAGGVVNAITYPILTDRTVSGTVFGSSYTASTSVSGYFSVDVRQTSGSARGIVAGSGGIGATFVTCTYLGAA